MGEISPQQDSAQNRTDGVDASGNYSLLIKLQQQLEQQQQDNRKLSAKLEQLEARLDRQYTQNFRLRLNEQRLRRENEQLKAHFLEGHDQGS